MRNFDFVKKQSKRTLVAQTFDLGSVSTTSTTLVPMIGTGTIVNSKGAYYRVHWSSSWYTNNGGIWSKFVIMVNGQQTSPIYQGPYGPADMLTQMNSGNGNTPTSVDKIIYLGPGTHFIQIHWLTTSGTAGCYLNTLNVVEEG